MLWEWSEGVGLAGGFVWRRTGSLCIHGQFSDQGAWRSMVSADPDVYLENKLLALGNGDALHENASFLGAAFVELAVDYSKGFGLSGYPAGCVAFLWEDFV